MAQDLNLEYHVVSTSWSKLKDWFLQSFGSVVFVSFVSSTYMYHSVKLLILGSIIEFGRRVCQWLFERFRFQCSLTAQFDEGDPAYEWMIQFLNLQNVWRRSSEFHVSVKSSARKWGISSCPTNSSLKIGNAEYVPTYEQPRLFRWRGYWLEIKRSKGPINTFPGPFVNPSGTGPLFITIYTTDVSVLSKLVEEARLRYIEVSRPNVIVHMADAPHYNPTFVWSSVKRKLRRPICSIILPPTLLPSLLDDAREFLDMEEWYNQQGIPHRRGYLLYGPPGSGKSSTIYALAGELGMEIYSLSLASGFVDDAFLQRAANSIPKHSIFLIEDIDCAFSSREEGDGDQFEMISGFNGIVNGPFLSSTRRSSVTLSTLLNVIDGVGSEEGKLFFTTTNYIDRLDPALLRPGRIDRKIEYTLATKEQATALFVHFFPAPSETAQAGNTDKITKLSQQFGSLVPSGEFSVAELQGYLLGYKTQPEKALEGLIDWLEREHRSKVEKLEKEERSRKILQERSELLARRASNLIPPLASAQLNIDSTTTATTADDILLGIASADQPLYPSPAYKASEASCLS